MIIPLKITYVPRIVDSRRQGRVWAASPDVEFREGIRPPFRRTLLVSIASSCEYRTCTAPQRDALLGARDRRVAVGNIVRIKIARSPRDSDLRRREETPADNVEPESDRPWRVEYPFLRKWRTGDAEIGMGIIIRGCFSSETDARADRRRN